MKIVSVNSMGFYLTLFLGGLLLANVFNFFLYKKCKRLGLEAPMPLPQAGQIDFFLYVNKHAKDSNYKSLRPLVIIQNCLILVLVLLLLAIFNKAVTG